MEEEYPDPFPPPPRGVSFGEGGELFLLCWLLVWRSAEVLVPRIWVGGELTLAGLGELATFLVGLGGMLGLGATAGGTVERLGGVE